MWDLLTGDLALDPLEPAVQIVEVLPGLAELLLHGLLKRAEKEECYFMTSVARRFC